jgi:hypothetical protein
MKHKRQERVERRRSLVEINLIGEPRSRSASVARRARLGCALFGSGAAILAASGATLLGLH